jgi:PleD family two-component response regulator
LKVHFSSGVAVHDQVEALNHTLERADRALYRAKDGGRGLDIVAPAGKH